MYNNIGKRVILIFPKFENMDIINEIRNNYDRLANLIAPHITLAFPFKDELSNEDLIKSLSSLLESYSPFKVTFKGVSLSFDNYIFLNCIKGNEEILKLHDEIYEKILPNHLNKDIAYIPHITLGQANNLDDLKDFNAEFTTLIDEVSIEFIGEHEESIVIGNIKLNKGEKI